MCQMAADKKQSALIILEYSAGAAPTRCFQKTFDRERKPLFDKLSTALVANKYDYPSFSDYRLFV